MANLERYRPLVQEMLTEYSHVDFSNPELETELIFDTERDRYQVVHVGWSNKRRVYGCVLHLDIKDGKIWIQHDGTEGGIANELVDRGVPKHDIVLGFHSPFKRQFTEFAVG
ncbi:XisI protein [Nodosilinea sp. LEGE 07298]|uniref:XisI protein n=1 Tax=Nodosilinea sp. LEGE 07298 TaxID=2777970 RepID=UPI00187E3A1E|nr:XisI protein [Nodosilinea sp. LEGE 07298]MBE9113034.1 XisI protein [Nodosilinea sp. LEGE 07298]